MADIVRIKLAGFKSFVDPVEVDILPGLTGIVGPNGCGKSNIVEGLRWAMGETSAKQLRGGGMDDVIFSGAAGRPARNFAEVTIGLADADGAFPAPWIGQAELEVSRRIERGAGSAYRVNGRETRARDVQTLFADLASGARSAAIVSQGQIGAFVVAKPEQRRSILEEAAGVAGLRARRHEATLRLNAAEANLERLEDVLLGFDNQLTGLRKQARQANRFRKISDLIRAAEAQVFIARWRLTETAGAEARDSARAAEAAVVAATTAAAAAERLATEATAALPNARKVEAEAAAAQQRLRLELERIDAERRRRADAKAAARQRLEDGARDAARETQRGEAARAAMRRLEEEASELVEAAKRLDDPAAFDLRIAELAEALQERSRRANAAADQAAEIEAAGRAAVQRRDEARQRAQRAQTAADAAAAAFRAAQAEAPAAGDVDAAAAAAAAARADLDAAQTAADAARLAAEAARQEADAARDARAEASKAEAALAAEAKTLAGLLERGDDRGFAPALASVRARDGYEIALGAALGDDLEAALDPGAPAFWSGVAAPADAALPAGARPLAAFVDAPAALAVRLAQIGVVESAEAGAAAAAELAMGQRLVTAAGDLWRWDGFCRKAGAETAAARKLALQNRLGAVAKALASAHGATAAAAAAAAAARAAAETAVAKETAARDGLRAARQAAEQRAQAVQRAERAEAAHKAGIAAKAEAATLAARQAEETAAALAEAETAAAAVADPSQAKAAAQERRAEANQAQLALSEARGARQRLEAAQAANAARRRTIEQEAREWRQSAAGAAEAIVALEARAEDAEAAIAAADAGDANETVDRERVIDALEVAEAQRRTLADALVRAETAARERSAAARAAEAAAGKARERRVAAAAAVEQARRAAEALTERIADRLDATPADLATIAGVDADKIATDIETLNSRVERLRRERETMGAVNLRAEAEIAEIDAQSETIRREREDLTAAIAKLRRGVAELSGEARQRLRAAFDRIDREFSQIFRTLFGGGRARLALVGSEDPLDAGLEIMASPPGKSLQTLSLLSGGERALTAMALVFAAFRCNPSPICVLDEIDAPLDDSNVDRVCLLLEEMASEGKTRFLVVTHHRMTMARMDRLYGVTMPERGVSQLVSVDFEDAQALREAG